MLSKTLVPWNGCCNFMAYKSDRVLFVMTLLSYIERERCIDIDIYCFVFLEVTAPTCSLCNYFCSLYGRHMQADPDPPKKNNDKSKKISRKPLAAKNK